MSKIKTLHKTSKNALEHSRSINYTCHRRNGLSHKENGRKHCFSALKTQQGQQYFLRQNVKYIYMEKVREYTLSTVVNHSYITFYIYGLIISLFHIKVTTRSNKPPLLQFRLLSYCIALFSHRHNKITNITSYNDFNVQLVIIFFKYIFQIRICTHLIKIA